MALFGDFFADPLLSPFGDFLLGASDPSCSVCKWPWGCSRLQHCHHFTHMDRFAMSQLCQHRQHWQSTLILLPDRALRTCRSACNRDTCQHAGPLPLVAESPWQLLTLRARRLHAGAFLSPAV